MAEEKGVALAILGIVAVIAVVGLVLMLSAAKTANVAGVPGAEKVYGGALKEVERPYTINRPVKGVTVTPEGIPVANAAPKRSILTDIPSELTTCGPDQFRADFSEAVSYVEQDGVDCVWNDGLNSYCCTRN